MTRSPYLRLGGRARAGDDRVRLLEAIARHGSITAAGREMGLGFRATWDAVQAANNLFPKPLITAMSGGRAGGAARLTLEGEAALRTLRHVQAEIALTMERLGQRLANDPAAAAALNDWSLVMRTSARNALRGVISAITVGSVNCEVALRVDAELELVAIISKRSVESLGLVVGDLAVALIKASFIILAEGDGEVRTSARNRVAGTVVAVEDGAVNSDIILELAGGKTLAATITRHSEEVLKLKVGDRATALIKASHIILAVE